MIDALPSNRLIFVTGKGGVGKSTACAALGLSLSQQGKRVLLIETDTYSALAELFEVKLTESKITRVSDTLSIQNLRSEDALIHAIRKFLPSERIARTVIQNRVARVFFGAAPSVNEFSILNQVYDYLHEQPQRFDHVLVDLPASGHAVTFLNVPDTLHDMMRGLGRFAALAKTIGEFIRNPEECSITAVCLPEEMPVNETIELAQAFEDDLGRGLSATLLNMVHPAPFDAELKETFEHLRDDNPEGTSEVVVANDLALQWHERDVHYTKILHERMTCPIIQLPMLYERTGGDIVRALADTLSSDV